MLNFYELRSHLQAKPLRIVFFGTPEFAAYSLQLLAQSEHHIVAVVTAPDKPAGRGMNTRESDVKKMALQLGLPVMQPTNLKDPEFQDQLRKLQTDLGIVIAFRMLPEAVWSMPKLGTFNLHASLLPQYRGAAPINHAIINGETQTGVTTFFLKHEIDTGDIVLQQSVAIENDDNAGTLHDKLKVLGGSLVIETLKRVARGNWPSSPQQLNDAIKAAPKLSREFNQIGHTQTAEETRNKIRGLAPVPGAWGKTPFGEMKFFSAVVTQKPSGEESLYIEQGKLYWPCKDFDLQIEDLQPAGKPKMKASDFVNGQANKR